MNKEIEIPEGYEARIEGNKVIFVPKESEDERIRKELLKEIEFISPRDGETDGEGLILPSYHARIDRYKSYLEKQKVQQPAEWSEEDDALLKEIVSFFKDSTVKLQHDLDLYAGFLEKRFKSLPHWKPSAEQMKSLKIAASQYMNTNVAAGLWSLVESLKKL